MPQIRLIAISLLFALMIWVAADISMSESETFEVAITLESTGGEDMHVELVDASKADVEVEFAGSRSAIENLRRSQPIQIGIPITERATGVYTLKLDAELSADTNRLSNVVIQKVTPPTLEVQVIRDQTVTMPIAIQNESLEYEVQPLVDPENVSVTISELALKSIDKELRRVILDADEHLRTAERGKMLEKVVPLRPVVEGFGVRLDPEYVTLRAQLKAQDREKVLDVVPIRIEASMDIFNDFNVEVRDAGAILTQTITIKGPIEFIERVESSDTKIHGVISLTAEDKANPDKFRYITPRFSLPAGVILVGEAEPIEIRLVPREVKNAEAP